VDNWPSSIGSYDGLLMASAGRRAMASAGGVWWHRRAARCGPHRRPARRGSARPTGVPPGADPPVRVHPLRRPGRRTPARTTRRPV